MAGHQPDKHIKKSLAQAKRKFRKHDKLIFCCSIIIAFVVFSFVTDLCLYVNLNHRVHVIEETIKNSQSEDLSFYQQQEMFQNSLSTALGLTQEEIDNLRTELREIKSKDEIKKV